MHRSEDFTYSLAPTVCSCSWSARPISKPKKALRNYRKSSFRRRERMKKRQDHTVLKQGRSTGRPPDPETGGPRWGLCARFVASAAFSHFCGRVLRLGFSLDLPLKKGGANDYAGMIFAPATSARLSRRPFERIEDAESTRLWSSRFRLWRATHWRIFRSGWPSSGR